MHSARPPPRCRARISQDREGRSFSRGGCHHDTSKKSEPGSLPVFRNSLRYHLKPRPIEAEDDLKENRKDRRTRKHAGRRARLGGSGGTARLGQGVKQAADPKFQAKPEPVSGWITRAEARNILGIDETELTALLARFRLRQSWVEVYSKPRSSRRAIVEKLR